jgi:hypothetical protein
VVLVEGYELDNVYQGNVNTLYLFTSKGKGKGKSHTMTRHEGTNGGIKVRFYPFFNLGLRRDGG